MRQLLIENKSFVIFVVLNINFQEYLLQKIDFLIEITRFKGLKLRKSYVHI